MSKFLTPPVWYDSNGNLVEILKGISQDGGVGIGESANAGSGAVVIGNNALATSATDNSNGSYRVWIGYTAAEQPTVDMKPVVIGTIREGIFSDYGNDQMTVSGSVLIGGNISYQFPILNINGSTIINSKISTTEDILQNVIAIGYQSGALGATSNYIQIGSSDKTYSAQIGDGKGLLRCRSLEVAPISYRISKYIDPATNPVTISYPDKLILEKNGIYGFVFLVNGGFQTIPIVFNGTKSDAVKTYFNLSYGDTSNDYTIVYGSVVWGETDIKLRCSPFTAKDGTFIKIYLSYIVYFGSYQDS